MHDEQKNDQIFYFNEREYKRNEAVLREMFRVLKYDNVNYHGNVTNFYLPMLPAPLSIPANGMTKVLLQSLGKDYRYMSLIQNSDKTHDFTIRLSDHRIEQL